MAFIKRSTVKPVHAKIGRHMPKCPKCGKPFVSQNKKFASACQNCSSNTDNLEEEKPDLESDLDQE